LVLQKHSVIHCDLSPRNFLLDSDFNVRIADFGGASLSGSEPSATPATRFRPPRYDSDATPVFQDDLFSLGPLIYFIMTGSYPYEDLPSDKVESRFELNEFPDISSTTGGNLIRKCCEREATSAQSISASLAAIRTQTPTGAVAIYTSCQPTVVHRSSSSAKPSSLFSRH
jgi:serine/threonine protein kinase